MDFARHLSTGILFSFACCATLFWPALASPLAPDPGHRYSVSGLKASDRLNVRAGPASTEALVETLAPNAAEVVVTGRSQTVTERRTPQQWWEIVVASGDRKTGWVNSRFLVRSAADPAAEPESGYPLQCLGTEPFWNLEIDGANTLYREPERPDGKPLSAGSWINATGLRNHFAIRLEDGDAFHGIVTVLGTAGRCSDNMSDFEYPFHASYIRMDGSVLGGCCSRSR